MSNSDESESSDFDSDSTSENDTDQEYGSLSCAHEPVRSDADSHEGSTDGNETDERLDRTRFIVVFIWSLSNLTGQYAGEHLLPRDTGNPGQGWYK